MPSRTTITQVPRWLRVNAPLTVFGLLPEPEPITRQSEEPGACADISTVLELVLPAQTNWANVLSVVAEYRGWLQPSGVLGAARVWNWAEAETTPVEA